MQPCIDQMCVGKSYYEPRTTAADGEAYVRFDGEEVTTPAMPAVIDAIIDSLAELA